MFSKNNGNVALSTELALELTMLYSLTQYELRLKTKPSFLTSAEALQRWGLFFRMVKIIGEYCSMEDFVLRSYTFFFSNNDENSLSG